MHIFSAICVDEGDIRRIWFEAENRELAHTFCRRKGFGFDGTASPLPTFATSEDQGPLPEAYDEKTARRMLGGISLATLYRWLEEEKVERVPNTRRLLVTRQSIERLTRRPAA
jgi:hypothetical protein